MAENEIVQEILQRLVKLETLLESKMNNTDERLKKLESNQEWLWRGVVGGIIAACIGFFIKK
jgi:hypothetical protein